MKLDILSPAATLMLLLAAGCRAAQPDPLVASPAAPSTVTTPPAVAPPPLPPVLIPAGSYQIGPATADDTQPVHQVALQAFLLDRTEVTNAQYAEFLNSLKLQPLQDAAAGAVQPDDLPETALPLLIEGTEGSQQSPLIALDDEHARIAIRNGQFEAEASYADHPVTETTWLGAVKFCQWREARLPTEVEWEAAARGAAGRTYPWGNEPPTPARAVYGRQSGETAPVGSHPAGATPEGIQDLAGNVAEWTSTVYRPYPYSSQDGREQPTGSEERVTRGGDHVFDSAPNQLTTYFRTGFSRAPDRGHRHIGFRCAQTP